MPASKDKLVERGDPEILVRRDDVPGSHASQAMHHLAGAGGGILGYSLQEILQNYQVKPILLKGNIFISGKVGFFDIICKELISTYQKTHRKKPIRIRTESELSKITTAENKTSTPIILIPAAKNQEAINQMIASAFDAKIPVWLVALPSKIEKQLLVAFGCFFITQGAEEDRQAISDITSFSDEDDERLRGDNDIQAILVLDQSTQLGLPDRLGSVIYVNSLRGH